MNASKSVLNSGGEFISPNARIAVISVETNNIGSDNFLKVSEKFAMDSSRFVVSILNPHGLGKKARRYLVNISKQNFANFIGKVQNKLIGGRIVPHASKSTNQ